MPKMVQWKLGETDRLEAAPFLPGSGSESKSRFNFQGRWLRAFLIFFAVLIVSVFFVDQLGDAIVEYLHPSSTGTRQPPRSVPLHILLPATQSDTNLCKSTLSLSILGYTNPLLLGWGENADQSGANGIESGGKISKIVNYLNTLPSPDHDNDLVFIADSDDLWFQLPPQTLVGRYRRINRLANSRLIRRLGRKAFRVEEIDQRIIFGASKTCAPGDKESIACYPVPFPPTRGGPYASGRNDTTEVPLSALRPRYLDTAYMVGPVSALRDLFNYAQGLVAQDPLKFTTSQAIFAHVFGEQEFQREVIRQRHRSWFKKFSPANLPGGFRGQQFPDIINPPWQHESMDRLAGHPREFGIGVDYWQELGWNTAESDQDVKFLHFNEDLAGQVPNRDQLHCDVHLPKRLPNDIALLQSPLPPGIAASGGANSPGSAEAEADARKPWLELPLLTNLCFGSVPVMMHHSGEDGLKDYTWEQIWFQPYARGLMRKLEMADGLNDDGGIAPGIPGAVEDIHRSPGAYTDMGARMNWQDMCPVEWQAEIFRDRGGAS